MYRYLEANQTAKNVYRYGVRIVKGNKIDDAHHILPHSGSNPTWLKGQLRKDMDALRAKAKKAGFDMHEAQNGVALPTEFHKGLDSIEYYNRVLEKFRNASTRDEFVQAADELAEALLKESGKIK